MKHNRILSLFSLAIAILMTVSAMSFTFTSLAEDVADLIIPYSKIQKGNVDKKIKATVEPFSDSEKGDVIKITPLTATEEGGPINIDGYSITALGIDLSVYRYLTVEYKLTSEIGEQISPYINFLPNGGILKKAIGFTSVEPIEKGKWSTMTFNIGKAAEQLNEDKKILGQLHFYPFGQTIRPSAFAENDNLLLGNFTFSRLNPNGVVEYTADFKSGEDKAVGTAPANIKFEFEDKITLPEIPFTCEGLIASGWLASTGTKIYNPGEEFTCDESNVTFTVYWKTPFVGDNTVVIDFPPYSNGICDHKDTATLEKQTVEGKEVMTVIPNPATTIEKGSSINLDGWSYGGAKINVDFYSTAIVLYKYVSENPVSGKANLNIMTQGTFKKVTGMVSNDDIVNGRWATVSFDLSPARANALGTVDPIIKQMHYYPLGGNNCKDMSEEDRVYVAKMLFTDKPATGSAYNARFIEIPENKLFGINNNMTRAQACTIVARLVAGNEELVPTEYKTSFTDVKESDWFYKYIAYCENLGYLKSYSGTFLPNQAITRAEFVELLYNMNLLAAGEKNGTFTDVDANHPRFAVITAAGKAGLVNGYANGDGTFSFKPDNTITRAEVVKVINNAYGRVCSTEGMVSAIKATFSDVPETHWAYSDIVSAAYDHVTYRNDAGKDVWLYIDGGEAFTEDFTPDYESGEKFAEATEALIVSRKAEISASKSDYSEATGSVWYVANSGSDTNDGKTPATAFATINKAHSASKSGDAILFKRGDLWRGSWVSKAGITYSAFGEGDKPKFYGNTEGNVADASKWSLVEGTTNIWKYVKPLLDVGNIIYNDGEKTVTKIVPLLKGSDILVSSKVFDPKTSFTKNDTFISAYDSVEGNYVNVSTATGTLYVRCDEGNPGSVYDSIELALHGSLVNGGASNVIFDNLCLKYAGSHGIGGIGGSKNVTVRNCEIGYIGGTAQYYTASTGRMVRFGNGVEVYGSCDGYYISDCYVYQCYDAGITHQISSGGTTDCLEKDVYYRNNMIEKCIYNIEYFIGKGDSDTVSRTMKNINMTGNILSKSGFGWGMDPSRSASIKGWENYNRADGFIIENNIFFLDYANACHIGADISTWIPKFTNNTYVQKYGHTFTKIGAAGATSYNCYGSVKEKLEKSIGETGATIYYLKKDYEVK